MPTITVPNKQYVTQNYYQKQDGNFLPVEYSSRAVYPVAKPDVRVLNSNPNYKGDIAKMRDAGRYYLRSGWTSFVQTRYSFWYSLAANDFSVRTRGYATGSSPWDPSVMLQAYDSTLLDIALSRIKRKLANHTKHMNALVPLAEIHELHDLYKYLVKISVEFMYSVLGIMRNPLAVMSYNRLGAQILQTKFTDMWLAYSFAIKPTLMDIEDAVAAIQNYLGDPPRTVVLKGGAQREWYSSGKFFSGVAPGSYDLDNVVACQHYLQYIFTAGFRVNLLSANSYNSEALRDQFGVSWDSVPSTIYELIPFSWMFDYFSTVGAYLDDCFESKSGDTYYVNMSRRYQCKMNRTSHVVGSSNFTWVERQKCVGGQYTYLDFERTILSQLPHRSVRLKTTDEIGKKARDHLLNLISIFASGKSPIRG